MKENWEIPLHKIININKKKTDYCVCIPIINEGEKIKNQLLKMKENGITNYVDIIICDGGSTDASLSEFFLESVNVRTLLIKEDVGKLSAQLRMGYAYALKEGYKGILTVDGNNKDSIENIPDFVKKLEEGYDFVQGSRFLKKGNAINTPKFRYFGVKLVHIPIISLLSGYKYTDTTNGFRAYSPRLLLNSDIQIFRKIFDTYELLAYLSVKAPKFGYNIIEIPVIRKYPKNEKPPTKITFFRGNFKLISILFNLMVKKYDPK